MTDDVRHALLDGTSGAEEDEVRLVASGDPKWLADHAVEVVRAHPHLWRHTLVSLAAAGDAWATIGGIALAQSGVVDARAFREFLGWHTGKPWALVVGRALGS